MLKCRHAVAYLSGNAVRRAYRKSFNSVEEWTSPVTGKRRKFKLAESVSHSAVRFWRYTFLLVLRSTR